MWKRHLKRGLPMPSGLAILAAAAGLSGAPARAQLAGLPSVSPGSPCLESGKAYLRARIRGAIRLDLDMRGRALACEGGPRLDGSGIRMGFEGRAEPGGRRVRIVFGIAGAKEGRPGRELPTNLTVIFEGEKLLFATQGDGNCTVDRLRQERIGRDRSATGWYLLTAKIRLYRVVAHGFCIAPANDLGGRRRIMVTTFDFAGRADFEQPPQRQK